MVDRVVLNVLPDSDERRLIIPGLRWRSITLYRNVSDDARLYPRTPVDLLDRQLQRPLRSSHCSTHAQRCPHHSGNQLPRLRPVPRLEICQGASGDRGVEGWVLFTRVGAAQGVERRWRIEKQLSFVNTRPKPRTDN